jgi:hypothetical protein
MYRVRLVLRFMREHKFTTSFFGTALGGALINLGLTAPGATIGMLAALWGLIGFLGLFSGWSGSGHSPGIERINGVSYTANSPEAISARQYKQY